METPENWIPDMVSEEPTCETCGGSGEKESHVLIVKTQAQLLLTNETVSKPSSFTKQLQALPANNINNPIKFFDF